MLVLNELTTLPIVVFSRYYHSGDSQIQADYSDDSSYHMTIIRHIDFVHSGQTLRTQYALQDKLDDPQSQR